MQNKPNKQDYFLTFVKLLNEAVEVVFSYKDTLNSKKYQLLPLTKENIQQIIFKLCMAQPILFYALDENSFNKWYVSQEQGVIEWDIHSILSDDNIVQALNNNTKLNQFIKHDIPIEIIAFMKQVILKSEIVYKLVLDKKTTFEQVNDYFRQFAAMTCKEVFKISQQSKKTHIHNYPLDVLKVVKEINEKETTWNPF